ncbi:unnamed protein product [Dracunculus medinensis]|uniref:C2 domain-containing protein n=1 Tax=Dracunculus medinensis TaxID=318479 RepID=A0A0N4UL24_DRAME|nr:unnamed protein product [Dracunculus medinensis]
MEVVDYDQLNNDDSIGELIFSMRNVKFSKNPLHWRHLQIPNVKKNFFFGELMLSLCYLPEKRKLTVNVVKAKKLMKKNEIRASDSYVKLYLVKQGVKLEKRKTVTRHDTLSPVFNQMFIFNLPDNGKLEVNLIATDHEIIGTKNEIGHVIIGPSGSENGIRQWNEIFNHPKIPYACWHKLFPKW